MTIGIVIDGTIIDIGTDLDLGSTIIEPEYQVCIDLIFQRDIIDVNIADIFDLDLISQNLLSEINFVTTSETLTSTIIEPSKESEKPLNVQTLSLAIQDPEHEINVLPLTQNIEAISPNPDYQLCLDLIFQREIVDVDISDLFDMDLTDYFPQKQTRLAPFTTSLFTTQYDSSYIIEVSINAQNLVLTQYDNYVVIIAPSTAPYPLIGISTEHYKLIGIDTQAFKLIGINN
jgi:hypothetical protein